MDSRSAWARMQREGAGALVDLAALDADAAVLDHVDAAPAVAADGVSVIAAMRSANGWAHAVERDRDAGFERDDELPRVGRRGGRVGRERVRLVGGATQGSSIDAALDGAAPEVLVDRVRVVAADLDRDVVAGGVLDRVLAGRSPSRGRGRRRRGRGRARAAETSKRTWSLPLPVQPCATASAPCSRATSTRCCTMTGRDERGDERVLAFVEGVGLQGAAAVVVGELGRGRRRRAPRWRRRGGPRSRMVSQLSSARWPTSTASAMTSTSHSAVIQWTATEVSSPPE